MREVWMQKTTNLVHEVIGRSDECMGEANV
jgi:hypothetical protein